MLELMDICLALIKIRFNSEIYLKIEKWAKELLHLALGIIIGRIDLWFACSEKFDSKKNIEYKAFKHFPRTLYAPVLKSMAEYLSVLVEKKSDFIENLELATKMLSVLEHLKFHRENLSSLVYNRFADTFSLNT